MPVNYNELLLLRKKLHSIPEVSGNEKHTSQTILRFLDSCNPAEIVSGIGGHGILATWDSGKKGKEILFRSELDALPIHEINEFDHRSVYPGVAHKCGHDGHSTILCGLARWLSENKIFRGKIHLLLQPSEENGEGAKAILADSRMSSIHPDFVFALHNLPGYPLHEMVWREDIFTAAVNSVIITLNGKTAHAAEPENGINPAMAVSEIIKESIELEYNHPEDDSMSVVTPVYIELGEKAYGISAGKAEVHFTLRCWNNENLRHLESKIEEIATRISKKNNLKVDFNYTESFNANENDKEAAHIIRLAAKNAGMNITEKKYPFKWGEDFGLFTQKYKGCMVGLGAGENTPALHNPDYDFPDELTETGVNLFASVIKLLDINKENV